MLIDTVLRNLLRVKSCCLSLITITVEIWSISQIKIDVLLVWAESAARRSCLILSLLLTGKFCFLIKVGQSLEEAEDFRLGKDVWEDAEVDAELLETLEVHLEATVGIELIESQHGLVNNAKHIDDALILKDLEKFFYLRRSICVHTMFRCTNLFIKLNKCISDHSLDSDDLEAFWWHIIYLLAYESKRFDELSEIHSLLTLALLDARVS